MLPVPFLDPYSVNRRIEARFFRELKILYRDSAFIGGAVVEKFEREFAAAMHSPACIAVASGTMALQLALAEAGVGPGDEVVVPAFTFPGTAGPILHLGARPVFADVNARDGCIDPESAARAVTKKTCAIVAAHLFGHPADMNALRDVAGKRIALIEDAAQAHGGAWRKKPLGSLGDHGCFSFYPTKNLGGIGDGGAILTSSKRRAERLRSLRDHGQRRRFQPETTGYNARLAAMHALFLSLKLPFLEDDNARRAAVAARYLRALRERPDRIPLLPSPHGNSAWHAFVVKARRRAGFTRHLREHKIGHRIYYPAALPDLPAFAAFTRADCPAARELARTVVALPLHAGLGAAEARAVCGVIKR